MAMEFFLHFMRGKEGGGTGKEAALFLVKATSARHKTCWGCFAISGINDPRRELTRRSRRSGSKPRKETRCVG